MVEYEAERLARIAENKRRMNEIGLAQASNNLQRAAAPPQRRPLKRRAAAPAVRLALSELRRSSRSEGRPAPNYSDTALDAADKSVGTKRRRTFDTLVVGAVEEKYTQEHIALLGDCQQPWELFVDGYDAQGNRIYDKVDGQTCHQCRQKTMGKRTSCSKCQSLSGVFCGDCLYMRYGENVDEANADPDWACPHCRDALLCNCSQHRTRRGWPPTGSLYRKAIALGYKSVAHYLVLNHLEEADEPLAAPPSPAAAAAAAAQPAAEAPAEAPATPPREEETGTAKASPTAEPARATPIGAPTRQTRIDDTMAQRKPTAGRTTRAAAAGATAAKAPTAKAAKAAAGKPVPPATRLAGSGRRVSTGPPAPETPPGRRRSCRLST